MDWRTMFWGAHCVSKEVQHRLKIERTTLSTPSLHGIEFVAHYSWNQVGLAPQNWAMIERHLHVYRIERSGEEGEQSPWILKESVVTPDWISDQLIWIDSWSLQPLAVSTFSLNAGFWGPILLVLTVSFTRFWRWPRRNKLYSWIEFSFFMIWPFQDLRPSQPPRFAWVKSDGIKRLTNAVWHRTSWKPWTLWRRMMAASSSRRMMSRNFEGGSLRGHSNRFGEVLLYFARSCLDVLNYLVFI